MNSALQSMLDKYKCQTRQDYENALKEIIQEIALLGLWRAKFFEHAAFYGGTALRILYGIDRFSEDIDFSLLKPSEDFKLQPYLDAIEAELTAMGFEVVVEQQVKKVTIAIESGFIKADTKIHFIKLEIPEEICEHTQRNDRMKIKIEVDTNPPGGFETEAKVLLQPIAFSVRTYKPPDLFAGKLHAVLARSWLSGRIKGRDYYDFVWYIARGIPVRLSHLEQRLRQTGLWTSSKPLSHEELSKLLEKKFANADIELAKKDVLPFIKDPQAVALWSKDFFISLVPRLTVV